MPTKEREILLKINELLKEAVKSPPPTFSPQTGEITQSAEYLTPNVFSLPPSPPKPEG